VDRLRTEAEVRDRVAGVNDRLRKARVGLMDGPPVVLPPLDADRIAADWRERREQSQPERRQGHPEPEAGRRTRRWIGRWSGRTSEGRTRRRAS